MITPNPNTEGPVVIRYKETEVATAELRHTEVFRRECYTDALESINTLYDIVRRHYGDKAIRIKDFNTIEYEVNNVSFNLTITEV